MTDIAAVLALRVRRRPGDPTPIERLQRKSTVDPDGCWVWNGTVNNRGYGCIGVNGKVVLVHRLAHHLLVGPIPDGLQVDHLCHNDTSGCLGELACLHRRCWRPDHLEAVSGKVNRDRAAVARRRDCAAGLHIVTGGVGWEQCARCHLPMRLWNRPAA